MSLRDLCDVVESRVLERLDEEDREDFYQQLNAPIAAATPTDELRRILGV